MDGHKCKQCGDSATIYIDPDFVGDLHGEYYCKEHGIQRVSQAVEWLIEDRNKKEIIPVLYFYWKEAGMEIIKGNE